LKRGDNQKCYKDNSESKKDENPRNQDDVIWNHQNNRHLKRGKKNIVRTIELTKIIRNYLNEIVSQLML